MYPRSNSSTSAFLHYITSARSTWLISTEMLRHTVINLRTGSISTSNLHTVYVNNDEIYCGHQDVSVSKNWPAELPTVYTCIHAWEIQLQTTFTGGWRTGQVLPQELSLTCKTHVRAAPALVTLIIQPIKSQHRHVAVWQITTVISCWLCFPLTHDIPVETATE